MLLCLDYSGCKMPNDLIEEEWNAIRKQKRWQYWNALNRMRTEYITQFQDQYDLTVRPTLQHWAEEKYGFKMGMSETGDYTETYTVVDPKKFMIFQIKYWQ